MRRVLMAAAVVLLAACQAAHGPRYEGQWQGAHTFPDGRRYVGEIREGKPHGRGVMTAPDGTRIEGEWREGEIHGRFIVTVPYRRDEAKRRALPADVRAELAKRGPLRIEVEPRDGRYVVETWSNGARYEGEYRDGMRDGQGVFEWPSGKRYEGGWREGKYHGQGVETKPNGARYEGGWRDGKRAGQGVETKPDGERIEGEWRDGEFVGE